MQYIKFKYHKSFTQIINLFMLSYKYIPLQNNIIIFPSQIIEVSSNIWWPSKLKKTSARSSKPKTAKKASKTNSPTKNSNLSKTPITILWKSIACSSKLLIKASSLITFTYFHVYSIWKTSPKSPKTNKTKNNNPKLAATSGPLRWISI